jgi:micrococcal nuclease
MQILLISVVAAVAAIQTPSAGQRLTRSESVLVRRVMNGDTIDVAGVGRVRLLGIDAPRPSEPLAREARERLAALVLRRWVRLEHEGSTLDAGDRQRAYLVRDDGLFINAVLVREGLARASARRGLARQSELERAESEARSSRRGMWGSAPPAPGAGYTHRSNGARSPSIRSRTTRKTRPKGPIPKT